MGPADVGSTLHTGNRQSYAMVFVIATLTVTATAPAVIVAEQIKRT
ncbi:hypothetical protein ACIBG0_03560 [Nocardia sp. NPDC050630]